MPYERGFSRDSPEGSVARMQSGSMGYEKEYRG